MNVLTKALTITIIFMGLSVAPTTASPIVTPMAGLATLCGYQSPHLICKDKGTTRPTPWPMPY